MRRRLILTLKGGVLLVGLILVVIGAVGEAMTSWVSE